MSIRRSSVGSLLKNRKFLVSIFRANLSSSVSFVFQSIFFHYLWGNKFLDNLHRFDLLITFPISRYRKQKVQIWQPRLPHLSCTPNLRYITFQGKFQKKSIKSSKHLVVKMPPRSKRSKTACERYRNQRIHFIHTPKKQRTNRDHASDDMNEPFWSPPPIFCDLVEPTSSSFFLLPPSVTSVSTTECYSSSFYLMSSSSFILFRSSSKLLGNR